MARKAKPTDQRANVDPDKVADCFHEYAGLRADAARLAQRMSVTLARYEKDGVDPRAIKHAYGVASKDPREATVQHRRNSEYLAILEIITFDDAGQGGFMAGLEVAKPSAAASEKVRAARAYNDAYNSALHGAKLDSNPFAHEPGSEEYVRWRDGFSDGHTDRLARNPDLNKVTQAEPRRRGRPRENGAGIPEDVLASAGMA